MLIGYFLSFSNPPDGYVECGTMRIAGKIHHVCHMWRDYTWTVVGHDCNDT